MGCSGRLNRGPQLLALLGVEMYWIEEQADRQTPAHQVRNFADTLAHELRTPLNAAVITAQLLELAEGRPSETQQLVALIRRNLERADAVLRNVRTVVLHLPADSVASAEPFGQVLAGVLADVREEMSGSGVRLELEEPIPGHAVDAPPVRLILTNLVRNAVRYRDPAKQSCVKLCFRRRGSDGLWWAEVSDNGLGIPPEFRDRVLRQVFRAHPEQGSGLGLGLTIVSRAIDQLRADIEFESVAGVGTTFRFSLPEAAGA